MKTAGIVAEYNPFHTGHAFQIRRTREMVLERFGESCAVVAVMSGNWTQQGTCALADKWVRTRLALMGGVDLVLELPTIWACSSAESFARGAVTLLERTGLVDVLCFGSECGDVAPLQELARVLDSAPYEGALRRQLGSGASFALCRHRAAEELLGGERAALLAGPNNNLGVEYLRTLNRLNSSMVPMTVLRRGGGHHAGALREGDPTLSREEESLRFRQANPVLSATAIRRCLEEGRWDLVESYLPPGGRAVLEGHTVTPAARERMEWGMLAKIRAMGAEDWTRLPDSGAAEGLPRRLERAARSCGSIGEFLRLAKTRRYPHARLVRLLLRAWLELPAEGLPQEPPYLRVLGFGPRGQELLRTMKTCAALPVLIRPARVRQLEGEAASLFREEARCTDRYDLCLDPLPPCGREWRMSPVRWEPRSGSPVQGQEGEEA